MNATSGPGPTTLGDDSVDAIIARYKAKDEARRAFVAEHPDAVFEGAPRPSTGFTSIILSRSLLYPGGWRLTRFDEDGPSGHTEVPTYAEAVKLAVEDWGVDLSKVVFAAFKVRADGLEKGQTPAWLASSSSSNI